MRGGRLKSGLIIPSSVTSVKPPKWRCSVIVGTDEGGAAKLCGTPFTEDEHREYQRHVTACARQHLPEIQAQSKRVRLPGFFGPDAFDPEAEKWVRQNRQALIEGRKRLGSKRFSRRGS